MNTNLSMKLAVAGAAAPIGLPFTAMKLLARHLKVLRGAPWTSLAILCLLTSAALADELWEQRYNGDANGDDVAYAVAVDSAGNVIVTGSSMNAVGDRDFYTVKYSPSGAVIWSQRYDSGGGDDVATSVAVDSAGNVVVTGHTVTPPNSFGYGEAYTAMYAATDGSLLWEKHGPTVNPIYSPTVNDPREANRVTMDASGDVILAISDRLGSDTPFYIAKFAGANGVLLPGTLLWEEFDYLPSQRCPACGGFGAWITGLTLDSAGNVIVTGVSSGGAYPGNADSYTAKYDAASGQPLWYQIYDSPNHDSDTAIGVGVDTLGNVLVVGCSSDPTAANPELTSFYYVAKYAATDGQVLWQNQYQTPIWSGYSQLSLAVDGNGNAFISGASPANLGNPLAFSFAAKYASADGRRLWLQPYQSCNPGGDYPFAVATTSAGDLIVTGIGYDGDTIGYGHYHTVRYAGADGQVLWQQNYIGPGNLNHGRDTAQALAIDKGDNVIVTGGSQNAAGNYDYLTVKYLPSGTTSSTLACPADIVTGTDPGQCSAVVNYTLPVAIDACGNQLTVTGSPAPGSVFPKGTTAVTLSASDGTQCSFKATVKDTQAPAITCPAIISVGCGVDLLVPVSFAATATDNCDSNPSIAYSIAPGSGFPVGTTTVNCTATDSSGNQSSCSFTVTRAPLGFDGFLAPIGGADATGGSFGSPLRTFKLNSTIPVKFKASCGGASVLTGIHRLQVIQYTTQTTAGDPIDATPTDAATTGDEFRLNGNQWQFNLDTKATGMSAGIWLLQATLSDGSQHSAWIQIK